MYNNRIPEYNGPNHDVSKEKLDILIAEDNPILTCLMRKQLSVFSIPMNLEFARDGREALQKIQNHTCCFDLFITDLHMHGMNGFELLSLIYKGVPKLDKTKIYVLSNSYLPSQMKRVLEYSFVQEVLNKPVDPLKLKEILLNLYK